MPLMNTPLEDQSGKDIRGPPPGRGGGGRPGPLQTRRNASCPFPGTNPQVMDGFIILFFKISPTFGSILPNY